MSIPRTAPRALRRTASPALVGATGLVLFLLLWQWASTRVSSQATLPSVFDVAQALAGLAAQASFWENVGWTLGLALIGWLVAAVVGVAIGVLVGLSRTAYDATRVVLEFLRPIPAIVILPLAMLVFGPSAQLSIFLVVFGVSLPIAAQAAAGVESVDPVMRNTARSFGLSAREIVWRVILPGASPYIGTAMRVAAPVTLIMVVVAGMLGGAPGIGNDLVVARVAGRSADIFAYVLVLGLLGLLVQAAAGRTERALLHWHSAYRNEA